MSDSSILSIVSTHPPRANRIEKTWILASRQFIHRLLMRTTFGFLLVSLVITGCAREKGCWFDAGPYTSRPLPTRYGARKSIPIPVLDDKDVIKVHKKAWSLYFRHLRWPRQGTGFPSDYIDEAFNPHLFQWDTAFMMFFGRYAHRAFPAIVSFDNFYAKQHHDGYICRELDERTGEDFIYKDRKHTVNPPLFAWAEWAYFRVTGDASRLGRVLTPLVKYYDWIRENRRSPNGLYWNTGLGSGMDNTPRAGEGWICMTAQQALAARNIARIAARVGARSIQDRFLAEYAGLERLINDKMWDEKDGFYYDVKDGKPNRVKTPASFWPLVAGVVPPDRARCLARHMRDPETFRRPHMIPTLSADHEDYDAKGDYWKGSVWAPTNYMAVKGFAAAGFHDLAREIAENHLRNMVEVFKKTETLWENYAPETAEKGSSARSDFVGWSGLGPTALLYEHVLGFDADGTRNLLTWHLNRLDRHGLKQLGFGTVQVDVVAQERKRAEDPPLIEVKTDGAFTLEVIHPKGTARRAFPAGKHTWKVKF